MPSANLGERIRSLRERHGLSQETLAEQAGVDLQCVLDLEEKNLFPHMGPLLRLSRVLGVRLGTLMDSDVFSDFSISRKTDHTDLAAMNGLRSRQDGGLLFHSLGIGKADRHMEPFLVEIVPDPENAPTLSTHEGEQFIMVMSGEVDFQYGNERYTFTAGDSVYFNLAVPHHIGCGKCDKATACVILYMPDK